MPTIELTTPAQDPATSRRVRAPGGYESCYFMAGSSDGRTQIMAGLHFGYAMDRNYARLYLLYRAFPTRIPPPEPTQHESVSLTIAHEGRWRREFWRVHPHGPELVREDKGGVRLSIRDVDLVFRSISEGVCGPIDDGAHHVIVTAPLCEVRGTIASTPFDGLGCRDHRWGTRWLRETGGSGSGANFAHRRTTYLYIFGNRKHMLEGPPIPAERACSDEPMLAEVIRPSRWASRLSGRGDR